jgi:hypothetical protein
MGQNVNKYHVLREKNISRIFISIPLIHRFNGIEIKYVQKNKNIKNIHIIK